MKKWEYLYKGEFQPAAELAEIGEQGWELVSFCAVAIHHWECNKLYAHTNYYYIFKRKKDVNEPRSATIHR